MKNVYELGNKFYKYFGIKPKLDNNMTILLNKPVLDMFEFDNFLHTKYGDYENEGLSMYDIIKNNYGDSAVAFAKDIFEIS